MFEVVIAFKFYEFLGEVMNCLAASYNPVFFN
jgi:hypothetical protein